jgi:hypothetical protein
MLFVCRGCVAGSVRTVVVESRRREAKAAGVRWNLEQGGEVDWETVSGWMQEAREEWKTQVPEMYDGQITACDMDEVWSLMIHRGMTKDQFCEWLSQRAWDNASKEPIVEEEAAVPAEFSPADEADMARQWARFGRRQRRGISFADMLPLTEDSDMELEEAVEEAIEEAIKEAVDDSDAEDSTWSPFRIEIVKEIREE